MICPKNKHLVYPLNFSMPWHNEGAFHFLCLSIFIKQILFLPYMLIGKSNISKVVSDMIIGVL